MRNSRRRVAEVLDDLLQTVALYAHDEELAGAARALYRRRERAGRADVRADERHVLVVVGHAWRGAAPIEAAKAALREALIGA